MPAVVDPEICTGCESCVEACPVEAISMNDDVAAVDPEACANSAECVDACPVEAIRLA